MFEQYQKAIWGIVSGAFVGFIAVYLPSIQTALLDPTVPLSFELLFDELSLKNAIAAAIGGVITGVSVWYPANKIDGKNVIPLAKNALGKSQ